MIVLYLRTSMKIKSIDRQRVDNFNFCLLSALLTQRRMWLRFHCEWESTEE